MFQSEGFSFSAEDFSGVVRLFPLPDHVMFPHVLQPLHIFESRYREMMEDALAGDGLIAMATLSPGWENEYDSRPPLYEHACLGHINTHHKLGDGRYNLLLEGLHRLKIVEELPPTRSFREARVEILEDHYPPATASMRQLMRKQLVGQFRKLLPASSSVQESLRELLSRDLPLGVITDVVAYAADLDVDFKQQLLAERDVDRRTGMLSQALVEKLADGGGAELFSQFPPEFSQN